MVVRIVKTSTFIFFGATTLCLLTFALRKTPTPTSKPLNSSEELELKDPQRPALRPVAQPQDEIGGRRPASDPLLRPGHRGHAHPPVRLDQPLRSDRHRRGDQPPGRKRRLHRTADRHAHRQRALRARARGQGPGHVQTAAGNRPEPIKLAPTPRATRPSASPLSPPSRACWTSRPSNALIRTAQRPRRHRPRLRPGCPDPPDQHPRRQRPRAVGDLVEPEQEQGPQRVAGRPCRESRQDQDRPGHQEHAEPPPA